MSPHRRKREIIQRIITYVIMTISVITLLGVCLFLVLGYSVDQKTGQPRQGGLIQFRTFPDGAKVSVDGAELGIITPGKTNVGAGAHTVEMDKDKYRSWTKSFELAKGELLWLNALLVPRAITTDAIVEFEAVYSMKASPDKKWIAVIEKPHEPIIKLIDLRDETKPKLTTLTLPASAIKVPTPNDTFKIAQWDFGSRYMLLQHTNGQTTDWLRIDRSDQLSTKNITSQLKLNVSDAHFAGTSGNNLYVLSDGIIREAALDTSVLSPPVASDVLKFELYRDNRIVYLGRQNNMHVVGVYREGLKQSKVIKSLPADVPVNATLSSYFDEDYLAVAYGSKVEIIRDPLDTAKKIKEFEVPNSTQWLYFANAGRFVVAQNGSALQSYDLERKQQFIFTIPGNPQYTLDRHLKWLDDFHLVSDAGNQLVIMEFDGSNAETIGNVVQGYDMTLSDNGKRLFSIGTNTATKKLVLQSSIMVLE